MVFTLQDGAEGKIIIVIIIIINTTLLPRGVCQMALGEAWRTLMSLKKGIYTDQTHSVVHRRLVR